MKTAYSVLWIDDNKRNQALIARRLEKRLLEYGLDLAADYHEEISQLDSLIEEMKVYNKYDAIFIDHNLTGRQKGLSLANKIRSAQIYTMVIYYSSDPINKLKRAVKRASIDGVYALNRESMSEELPEIITQQVSREFDVNNMRGYVLDLMSELEGVMRESLAAKITSEDNGVVDNIKTKCASMFQKQLEKLKRVDASTISQDVLEGRMPFDTVRQTLMETDKERYFNLLGDKSELFEMQRRRNVFAHRSHTIDSVSHRVCFAGDKLQAKGYSSDDFTVLRKRLLNVKKNVTIGIE